MKKIVILGFLNAVAALTASPAQAQAEPLAAWVKAVNRQLDRKIAIPAGGEHGIAYADFRRAGNGRAELVSVRAKHRTIARAARITVSRLRELPPMPAGFEASTVTMQMLIGKPDDLHAYHRERARLIASADGSNRSLAARVAGRQLAMSEGR